MRPNNVQQKDFQTPDFHDSVHDQATYKKQLISNIYTSHLSNGAILPRRIVTWNNTKPGNFKTIQYNKREGGMI